jgi:spermidine/putrescine transport system permease protein
MLGNIIADQILKSRNWPLASAISMVLTVVTTVGVLVMMNIQRREALRIADSGQAAEDRAATGARI